MRARTAVLLLLAALLTSLVQASIPVAHASDVVLAQETEGEGSGGGDDGATEGDEGSGGEGAEVGANEGQTEPAAEETGPVWTYQMAKIVLALLLIIGLMVGLSYWKLVVQRQRRGI